MPLDSIATIIKNLETMKKQLLVGLLALGMGLAAQAAQITGSITFAGTVTLNSASAGTATAVVAGGWHEVNNTGSPLVLSASGDFTGLTGSAATFTAAQWNFNSGAVASFWSVGGFTFNLTSSFIFSQGGFPAGVVVNGSGTISKAGFTTTSGTWSFSTQDPAAGTPPVFSFSAATGALVPDGGSTVALLGFALVGMEALRRRMRTAK